VHLTCSVQSACGPLLWPCAAVRCAEAPAQDTGRMSLVGEPLRCPMKCETPGHIFLTTKLYPL
jgi:hypothetical protein